MEISFADAVTATRRNANNLRTALRNGEGWKAIPRWLTVAGCRLPAHRWEPATGNRQLMHEFPPIPNVVREDVLPQPVRRRVERPPAIDLRKLLDEVHQHRVRGQHERRDRDAG